MNTSKLCYHYLSTTGTPGNNLLTITSNNWRANQNDSLWQGIVDENKPCLIVFSVSTDAELEIEITAYNITISSSAFASPLKLTVSGYRQLDDGMIVLEGIEGYYWESLVFESVAIFHNFNNVNIYTSYTSCASGFSVRCIKD